MLILWSLSATSPSLLTKVSQQEFIKGTICFIFKALNAGVSVFLIRFHFSLSALVIILSKGSGNFILNV